MYSRNDAISRTSGINHVRLKKWSGFNGILYKSTEEV
jgi:hypothetical protein